MGGEEEGQEVRRGKGREGKEGDLQELSDTTCSKS